MTKIRLKKRSNCKNVIQTQFPIQLNNKIIKMKKNTDLYKLLPLINPENETVVNTPDTRQLNMRFNQSPYRNIGMIILFYEVEGVTKQKKGTAFQIAPDIIVTVAHALIDEQGNQVKGKSLKYYPKQYGFLNKKVGISIIKSLYPDTYKETKDQPLNDYAICLLERCVINNQYILLSTNYPKLTNDIEICGYPRDRNYRQGENIYRQYTASGRVQQIQNDELVYYKIDTSGGQSGAPLLARFEKRWFAVGVHCSGSTNLRRSNRGCYFSNRKIQQIKRWIYKIREIPIIYDSPNSQQQIQYKNYGSLRNSITGQSHLKIKPLLHASPYNTPKRSDRKIMDYKLNFKKRKSTIRTESKEQLNENLEQKMFRQNYSRMSMTESNFERQLPNQQQEYLENDDLLGKIKKVTEQNQEIQNLLATRNSQYQLLKQRQQTNLIQIDQQRQINRSLLENIRILQQKKQQLQGKIKNLEDNIELSHKKTQSNEDKISQLENENRIFKETIGALEKDKTSLQDKISQLQISKNFVKDQISLLEIKNASLQEKYRLDSSNNQSLQAKIDLLQNSNKTLNKDNQLLRENIKSLESNKELPKKVQQYENRVIQLQKHNRSLDNNICQFKSHIRYLQDKNNQFQIKNRSLQEKNRQVERKCYSIQDDNCYLRRRNNDLEILEIQFDDRINLQIQSQERRFNSLARLLYLDKPQSYLSHPSNTDHRIWFLNQVDKEKILIRRIKKFEGATINWILNREVSRLNSKFRVRQGRASNGFMMMGIATSSIIGLKDACKHKQSITYYSLTGALYPNTQKYQNARPIKDGQVVDIEVDTEKWNIAWSVGEKILAKQIIPQSMSEKPIFFVVMIAYQGDYVELLFD